MNNPTMEISKDCPIHLPALLEGRLLAMANSGGGKSTLLRRILEQTHGKVQHLVIDPEGEFGTLREKFDYVVCAPSGGDAVANPGTASLLARRLLETGVSAILNIYDLKAGERIQFVRRFFEELVNARRELWHPALVILDEAHVFCPEGARSESAGAVIDLATRGRKRGYALCLATQRLSKLHKDAAAEMTNKLIGRTGLGIDVRRAADELGMTTKEAQAAFPKLRAGEFYAFGPALTDTVKLIQVGPVITTHPKSGSRFLTPPPEPSAKILEVLASVLKDIPKEVEAEARTIGDMKAEINRLRNSLVQAEKRAVGAGIPEEEVKRRIGAAVKAAKAEAPQAPFLGGKMIAKVRADLSRILDSLADCEGEAAPPRAEIPANVGKEKNTARASGGGLRSGAMRILHEICSRMPAGYTRAQVATLTGFSPSGGTFNTYLGDLRRGDYIEEKSGMVFATETGLKAMGQDFYPTPKTRDEIMLMWAKALRSGAFRMLQEVCNHPDGISRQRLALFVSMEESGGTFNTYLGDLRRNGLIEERNKLVFATSMIRGEK